jgi:hypothetical protein
MTKRLALKIPVIHKKDVSSPSRKPTNAQLIAK